MVGGDVYTSYGVVISAFHKITCVTITSIITATVTCDIVIVRWSLHGTYSVGGASVAYIG